jgi:hypothetical protein
MKDTAAICVQAGERRWRQVENKIQGRRNIVDPDIDDGSWSVIAAAAQPGQGEEVSRLARS